MITIIPYSHYYGVGGSLKVYPLVSAHLHMDRLMVYKLLPGVSKGFRV